MALMSQQVVIGMLLFGYTIISLISFKLAKETGIRTWVKLILSISTGWVAVYTVASALLYLREELQIQGQTMELTVFVSFVAFISFQILLYDIFDALKKKKEN